MKRHKTLYSRPRRAHAIKLYRCLARGCTRPVDSTGDAFCIGCAMELSMEYGNVYGL